jgi:hypothetical protein
MQGAWDPAYVNKVADKKVDWKAIDGFDDLSDHTDPWTNSVSGKRIFPDFKNPNDTTIRHKVSVVRSAF